MRRFFTPQGIADNSCDLCAMRRGGLTVLILELNINLFKSSAMFQRKIIGYSLHHPKTVLRQTEHFRNSAKCKEFFCMKTEIEFAVLEDLRNNYDSISLWRSYSVCFLDQTM